MKALLLVLLLFFAGTCTGKKNVPESEKSASTTTANPVTAPHFSEPWNHTFHLRETENGEILSIGSVFSNDTSLFVNDIAAGTVVQLDKTLSVVTTIPLESTGRRTWSGNDFIVNDTAFIFLNNIDRRLEFFNRNTGKHSGAVTIPPSLLSDTKKRSHRILTRIFIDNGRIYLGNEHVLVPFDLSLGKRTPGASPITAGNKKRFVLFKKGAALLADSAGIREQHNNSSKTIPETHFPVTGKRIFRYNNTLFTLIAGKDSVSLQVLP